MGSMVYSLLWVMQDFVHQPEFRVWGFRVQAGVGLHIGSWLVRLQLACTSAYMKGGTEILLFFRKTCKS